MYYISVAFLLFIKLYTVILTHLVAHLDQHPIYVFRHFFTCELINTIVQQTNLYAKQVMTPVAYT